VTLDIHNHLWDFGGDKTDETCKGQCGEEEVHEDVEVGVINGGSDHDEVSIHHDQAHGLQHTKNE
jgi:hypothetical protein